MKVLRLPQEGFEKVFNYKDLLPLFSRHPGVEYQSDHPKDRVDV